MDENKVCLISSLTPTSPVDGPVQLWICRPDGTVLSAIDVPLPDGQVAIGLEAKVYFGAAADFPVSAPTDKTAPVP